MSQPDNVADRLNLINELFTPSKLNEPEPNVAQSIISGFGENNAAGNDLFNTNTGKEKSDSEDGFDNFQDAEEDPNDVQFPTLAKSNEASPAPPQTPPQKQEELQLPTVTEPQVKVTNIADLMNLYEQPAAPSEVQ